MKKLSFILIVILGLFCITSLYAQENNDKQVVFYNVDDMPEYPGGMDGLKSFIQEKIKYPEVAKKKGITGKVFISFVVDGKGEVTRAEITQGVDPELDKEALRVINLLEKWEPGRQNGKKVNVGLTLPIMFALDNSDEKK